MSDTEHDEIRQRVRAAYGAIARAEGCGCGTGCCAPSEQSVAELLSHGLGENPPSPSPSPLPSPAAGGGGCCSPSADQISGAIGYGADETAAVPEGANLGLGCGNPQAIANLKPGEAVLDLGSGAGFDCFLAARAVGAGGRVIGVDMTPDMVSKARANAVKGGFTNVDFRLGEIEHLPVADSTVDVIISNCVINLSPDKGQVFRDAMRVLKPGGRLAISDIVLTAELPAEMLAEVALYTGCVAGAIDVATLTALMAAAGFTAIRIAPKDASKEYISQWAPGRGVEHYIASANIEANKPE